MNEISKYNYIKIEELTLNEDIKYITFNTNSKEIKPYKNKPNITNNEVIFIIFDREQFLQNSKSKGSILLSIKNSSFICSQKIKTELKSHISNSFMIDFLEKDKILKNINLYMNNETQSKKFYNNILKRLKYQNLELFEKTNEEREINFKNGIKQRDKDILNKKIKNKEDKEKEGIVPNIKKSSKIDLNF